MGQRPHALPRHGRRGGAEVEDMCGARSFIASFLLRFEEEKGEGRA